MLRDVRRSDPALDDIIDCSLACWSSTSRAAGALPLHRARARRRAARGARGDPHEIELFERELATDLARLPGTEHWSAEDLRVLSNLIVIAMVATAEDILASGPDAEKEVVEQARTQLRMVLFGALNWRSSALTVG